MEKRAVCIHQKFILVECKIGHDVRKCTDCSLQRRTACIHIHEGLNRLRSKVGGTILDARARITRSHDL